MSQTDIDAMAALALLHLIHFINRSASQQVRRMRATWSQPA